MKVLKIETSVAANTVLVSLAVPAGEKIEIGLDSISGQGTDEIVEMFESDFMDLMSKAIGFPPAAEVDAAYAKVSDWETIYTKPDNVVSLKDAAQ